MISIDIRNEKGEWVEVWNLSDAIAKARKALRKK